MKLTTLIKANELNSEIILVKEQIETMYQNKFPKAVTIEYEKGIGANIIRRLEFNLHLNCQGQLLNITSFIIKQMEIYLNSIQIEFDEL